MQKDLAHEVWVTKNNHFLSKGFVLKWQAGLMRVEKSQEHLAPQRGKGQRELQESEP